MRNPRTGILIVITRRTERGFSLLEVLITVTVVSVGLLGLAGLQFAGLRASNNAQQHTLATLLAEDIAERIHANAVSDYDSASIDPTSADCLAHVCSPNQMRDFDRSQWYYMVNDGGDNVPILPDTSIAITRSGDYYTVAITWSGPTGPQTLASRFHL